MVAGLVNVITFSLSHIQGHRVERAGRRQLLYGRPFPCRENEVLTGLLSAQDQHGNSEDHADGHRNDGQEFG